VTMAWQRVSAPLIRPSEDLPPEIRDALAYPQTLLRLQRLALAEGLGDDHRVPGTSPIRTTSALVSLVGDSTPRLWSLVPLGGRGGRAIDGLLAGSRSEAQRRLVRLQFADDATLTQWSIPGGDSLTGALHALPLDGSLFTQQTVYTPDRGATIAIVRVTWGGWIGAGLTQAAALAELGRPGGQRGEVPDVWGRLARAQALIRQADSMLTSGNFIGFAQAFEELKRVLAPPRSPR